MQTFKFSLEIDFTAIVPQQFLDQVKLAVAGEILDLDGKKVPASPFLAAQVGKSADDLMIAVISNAARLEVRHSLVEMLRASGCGAKVAPLRILRREPIQYATEPKAQQLPAEQVDINRDELSSDPVVLA